MGLFDFFNKGKKERERQEQIRLQQEAEAKRKAEEERRQAEARRREEERQRKEQACSIEPFVFKSNCHQRYEKNQPVMGLQECIRTITVEKNTNGCRGYKLEPGKGYIVKVYNDDQNKPNMSDKPMVIVRKTDTTIELRGFPIEAQTPFGWQEVDYRDYGLFVYYKDGQVDKCVLHMYDRDVRIEYMKKKTSANESNHDNQASFTNKETSETELFVQNAMQQLAAGNDGDAVYHPLYRAWRSFQNDPSQLGNIKDLGKYGMGLMIFLSYGTVGDIDDKQQIASIAYLFLSKAIRKDAQNVNLIKNRLLLMILNHEAFEYTVSSVVNKSQDFMSMSMFPFEARDAMYKMEFADLLKSPQLLSIDMLAQKYYDLQNKISNQFFGPNQDNKTIRDKGNSLHDEVLEYLERKVITNEDIDF